MNWRFGRRWDVLDEIRDLRLASERREQKTDELLQRREQKTDELLQQNRDEIQITREVIRRNEVAFVEQMKALREMSEKMSEEMSELAAESRAMREGLLALIDEMRGGGPSAATS